MSFFGRPQRPKQPQVQHQGPTLDVRVIGAHGLKKTELIGKSDPYVTLGFNEAGKGFVKTFVAEGAGPSPQWNQGFSIPVQGNDLFVEILDQEMAGDDVVGFAAIPISQLHPLPGSSMNGWFQLYTTDKAKPKGEINLILTLRPAVQGGYPNEQSVKGQSYPHQAQVKRLKNKEKVNLATDIGIGVLGAGLAVGAGFAGKSIYDQQQKEKQEEARRKQEYEQTLQRQKEEREQWEAEKQQFQTQKQTWEQEQAQQRQQMQQLQQERDQYQSRYQEGSHRQEQGRDQYETRSREQSDCQDFEMPRTAPKPRDRLFFGCKIAFKHVMTGVYLKASPREKYQGGSQQHIVFCDDWVDEDTDDVWFIIVPDFGKGHLMKEPLTYGSAIRLKHEETLRNLHSHSGITSPVTGQQEVTAFGDANTSDDNDVWILKKFSYGRDKAVGEVVEIDDIVCLIHKNTGVALHSHDINLRRGRQEVTCFGPGKEDNDKWQLCS